jgi:hypothetical protein
MTMIINFDEELERYMGKHTVDTSVVHGVSIEGRYIVNKSFAKNALFHWLMESYKEKFANDPKSKFKIFYIRSGNYLLVAYGDKVSPKQFVKSFGGEYAFYAKIVEMHENEHGLFVIIKPFNEVAEQMVVEDLRYCGFEIVENDDFIIAVAKVE